MKKLYPLLPVLFLIFWSCEDEVVEDTNNEEVFEVDRLYGLWFRDSTGQITDGDTSWVISDINDQGKSHLWFSISENELSSYVYLPPFVNCYSLYTRSITWEKIDDKHFKHVDILDDGSTINWDYYFKNDYDGVYFFGSNSQGVGSHFTKIEDWDFTPLCD